MSKVSVQSVLADLTKFIGQAGTTTFDNDEYIKKVKSLLPPLINSNLNANPCIWHNCVFLIFILVSAGEIKSVLSLVRGLCEKSPAVFSNNGDIDTIRKMIFKFLPFMSDSRTYSIHNDLIDTTCSLLSLFNGTNIMAFKTFFSDSILLLEGNLEFLIININ